ncbi:zinc-dependent alcohol dehydrogenase [Roseibium suaedae]|uniref:2-desacetyl-2-hydroxyethyl bacteriochlorophyllide A dehydrogenase n=1 Tax=Roseibium suaedae TaxID=735517 RepID=A0A1M7I0Z2_9HYPH|nr:zinc-binding alcohol dehydrogenase [Roseibium suaedae]SHM34067.1 2-desacetyl-2-hydroxyethyl bacteriochlorophyllide A dehydrogenase [Roseibium suaedae]
MTSARAFWISRAETSELRTETLAPLKAGHVRVKTLFSGISRGTEALVFKGLVPPGEHERMRGPNMGGCFSFPVKYGYAAVGRVEEGSADLAGKPVFCLHPHQDHFVVPEAAVRPIPENVPVERAILAANMETALNILWDAEVLPGDRVAVFGAGVVGALVAFLAARIPGTETILIDPNPARSALAASLDLSFARPEQVNGPFDVLINASATGEALSLAIEQAGQEARVVEASWFGEARASLSLGGAFHVRRLSLISSQVGNLPARQRARWDYSRRMDKALSLLSDPRLDALVSGETLFEDLPGAYGRILMDPATLCHRIRY